MRAWPGESFDAWSRSLSRSSTAVHRPHARLSRRRHGLSRSPAFARHDVGHGPPDGGLRAHRRACLRFGAERAVMALVTSLFHDAGYIREFDDRQHRNGAEFTLYHVTRSARFLARFLPTIGMESWVPVATRIVHFTGYEIKLSQIQLPDARDRKLGHLLGTADLIAQMADRCYLEKCRDRLYPEFVLGGIAAAAGTDGALQVRYSSGWICCGRPRSSCAKPGCSASKANSSTPTAISSRCSAARIPTSRRSTAISAICTACCAASAGGCCGAIRRCSPPRTISWAGARPDAESPEGALGLRPKASRCWPRSARAAHRAAPAPAPCRAAARLQCLRNTPGSVARRAFSATGAKLKCQGSGCTPDRTPRNGRKKPNRAAFASSHSASARTARRARTPRA
jgi:hypothetical protein